jgi:hypothetical protein
MIGGGHDPWADDAWAQASDPALAGDPWSSYAPAPVDLSDSREGFAIASLVLGILPVCGGVLGIVFGGVALGRIRRTGQRGKRMAVTGIVLGSLWLIGLIVAAVIGIMLEPDRDGSGAITGRGSILLDDLKEQDCIVEVPDHATRTVEVVPCSREHAATVYAIFRLKGRDYPGEAEVDRFAEGGCVQRWEAAFGKTEPEYSYYQPSTSTWALGDRKVICIAEPTAPGKPGQDVQA